MSTTELQPAPKLAEFEATNDKWQQEYQAFLRLKPRLLENYRGQYVAIHEGQVVGSGPDQIAVAVQAYDAFGYGPIYVGLVTDQPDPVYRIPTPRRYPMPLPS